MRNNRLALIAAALIALLPAIASAEPSTHERLMRLAEDITYRSAELYPMQATLLGIPGHDAEFEAPSEPFRAAYVAKLTGWRQELESIEATFSGSTALVDRDDALLLKAQLTAQLNNLLVYEFDRKDYSLPANSVVGTIFTQFQRLPVPGENGATDKDLRAAWSNISTRLAKAPAYIEAGQRLVTNPGRLFGTSGSKQLAGAPEFLNGALSDAAKAQFASDPAALRVFLRARDATVAAIGKTKAYLDAHAASWPENFAMGKDAYAHLLRDELLLPFDSEEISQMGRDQLAHGWAEETWLTSVSKRTNLPFGARSGGGMAPSGSALIGYYRERIAELKAFVVEKDVVTIPAWLGRMDVVETPPFLQPVMPGAAMVPPLLFSPAMNGFYFITPPKSLEEAAAHLDMNEDFDRDRILSTAAHEAMPGHFLQLSIAKRHPDFVRRTQYSSVFSEGWAYYGEDMFIRLGLYGDDLDPKLFVARWDRVRGARVVCDAKLARGEWTIPQAVDFFAEQTSFSHEAAEAAVAFLATSPGYGIAYTVGRFQLSNLLAEYDRRMGDKASLHDFHDRLLSYGSTPFAVVSAELLADLGKPASEVRAAANY